MKLYRSEAEDRYGEIVNNKWPREAQFCSVFKIPQSIAKTWINSYTGAGTNKIYINEDMADPLEKALELVEARGLIYELKTFDGCYSVRDVRGVPGVFSWHSYGLALDVNARTNKLGTPGNLSLDLVYCFKEAGFMWGGDFHRLDPMHFQWGLD